MKRDVGIGRRAERLVEIEIERQHLRTAKDRKIPVAPECQFFPTIVHPEFEFTAESAGRTFWLNPEPRLYWNYGDSVMAAYEPYCDGVFECWTTKQLEQFVNVVAGRPQIPS